MKGHVVIETEEMSRKDLEEAHQYALNRFNDMGLI
jgi:hypothetical protein